MKTEQLEPRTVVARQIVLQGRVQGLGVRPTIHRLATELSLSGVVRNTSAGVEVLVEGAASPVADFIHRIEGELPAEARVTSLVVNGLPLEGWSSFEIEKSNSNGPVAATVPLDLSLCHPCYDEITNPDNRRFEYPFTSCTACGPRYSIIRDMPYERTETTMATFPLCPSCLDDYTSHRNRRFHAQTNACENCGPQVWCVGQGGKILGRGREAIRVVANALIAGQIVALKGLGGYQLLVDAANPLAVSRLRQRKSRPTKPLAVMIASLEHAARYAIIDDDERRALAGASNPIVLVRAILPTSLSDSIHPGVDTLGLVLPTTPLHALLFKWFDGPLVCTSGNREGEPLEYECNKAERRLAEICDLWLHHDRPIAQPIDDSVVRVIAGQTVILRLARGLAPAPLDMPAKSPILALGGHMKSALAWSTGATSVLGPHIGDLDGVVARNRLSEQLATWRRLYQFTPQCIAHDAHPDYFTTRIAQNFDCPAVAAWHHHAHVVSGMVEHRWLDRTVLGVAWDGTGYGPDGSIWGGEFLIATATDFRRFAHLRPMRLPGGEQTIRQPWRMAVALLRDALGEAALAGLSGDGYLPILAEKRLSSLLQILDNNLFSPQTTSAGRLFDAAAAIILDLESADYDGQPAMMLESIADRTASGQYSFPVVKDDVWQLDWRPLVRELIVDKRSNVGLGVMAMKFHRTLADAIIHAIRLRPDLPVVLSGGVFQNRLLTELIVEISEESPQAIGLPGAIPPGDGGLAAGQLAIALARGGQPCA